MKARDLLKRNCNAAACCLVFRGDIFETQTGALVVYEFESLDGMVSPSGQHSIHNDTEMKGEHFRLFFFYIKSHSHLIV